MPRYDQTLRDPTELIVEPMGTTLSLHDEDLLEVRELEPPPDMLGPPDGVPWSPPDVDLPVHRVNRERSDAVVELPVEFNTTVSLHDEDLFEVRGWIEPPQEHTIQIDPDGLDASAWVWELKPPLNPGMRVIRILFLAALPLAALGAVISLTAPGSQHLSRLATALTSRPTADRRVETFGDLHRVDVDIDDVRTPAKAEATSPAPTPEVTPSLQVWAKVVEAAVADLPAKASVTVTAPRKTQAPRQVRSISKRQLRQNRWYRNSAKQAARHRRWRRARARAVAALKIVPTDRQARAIKRRAERKLRQHRRYLAHAKRAVRHKRWKQVRTRAVAALKIVPRDREARAIKRRAEHKLRQHRQYLAGARKAAKHKRWRRARSRAAAALRIAPRDRRARAIKRLAERKLRLAERKPQRRYL